MRRLCLETGCKTHPGFNFVNEKALYCVLHKKDNMVNVKSRKCEENGCPITASFNFENEKIARFCFKHKKDNMITSFGNRKRCNFENCKTYPYYNFENQKTPIYCLEHKKENMIRFYDKLCADEDCKKFPSFNYEGELALYCAEHKKVGMINIKCKNCIEDGCVKYRKYNFENEKNPLYCGEHKKENMIDIMSKRCKTLMCGLFVKNNKYDGYCLRCYINLFPDKPVAKNYKTKERSVVEFVQTTFPQYDWTTDKTIKDGCSRRRPDILLDMGEQVIIVEIDENQHTDYDCSCENKRTMELSKDIGHRPLVFVRFNPDDYINNEKKITSCWGTNKSGICVVQKSKTKEWNERLTALKQQIEYWTNNNTDKTVEIVQLFYNCDNS